MAIRVYISRTYGNQIPDHELWVSSAQFGTGELHNISTGDWVEITKFTRMHPWPHFNVHDRGIVLLRAHLDSSRLPIAQDGSWIALHSGTGWASRFPELEQDELDPLDRFVQIEFRKLGMLETVIKRVREFVVSFGRWTWVVSMFLAVLLFLTVYWGFDPSRERWRLLASTIAAFGSFVLSLIGVEALIRRYFSK